ncbi:heme-binding protein [Leptospira perolatii]|uniref:Heme-binding protein n=1 Tax=Leptospira perolatii TaxID=2023191 RepID=A0A2M9ZJD9_9LEPT|nr:heme-binding domain-containing protein [Leptospira perolatii]PJZ68199.1 heme-binding protein [Leptospira perolatii]PJZ72094.1 heme-binding protein [Leptospira perolatii]
MKRKVAILGVCTIVLIGVLQFVPVEFPSGENAKEIITEETVKKIFRKSCYDCHSDLVRWPWYSKIYPISVYLAQHVRDGKEELNFSSWEDLSQDKRLDKAEDIVEEVEEGKMPPWDYRLLHPDSKLTEEEVVHLKNWLKNYQGTESE